MKRFVKVLILCLSLVFTLFSLRVTAEETEAVTSEGNSAETRIVELVRQAKHELEDADTEPSAGTVESGMFSEASAAMESLVSSLSEFNGQTVLNQIRPVQQKQAMSVNSEASNWTRINNLIYDIKEYGTETSEGYMMINGIYTQGTLENNWAIFYIEADEILRFFNYFVLDTTEINFVMELDVSDVDYPFVSLVGIVMDTAEYETVAIPNNFDISTYTDNMAISFNGRVTNTSTGEVTTFDDLAEFNRLGTAIISSSVKAWKNAVYEWEEASMNDFGFESYDAATLPATFLRLAGSSRFDTSMQIAEYYMIEKGIDQLDSVILTSGLNFADALAGSYLSYKINAPILITAESFGTSRPYQDVNAFIKSNLKPGGTVYVLGGTGAVSDKALTGLTSFNIRRLSGKGRFDTNIAILKEAGVKDEDILVATGFNFADSLSASAVNKPILLVDQELSTDQKAYLDTLDSKNYYILGGTNAVKTTIENQLKIYGTVMRLSGKGRHETSVLIAETFCNNADMTVFAYSGNFPDGLCAGPLASAISSPLILTANDGFSAAMGYCKPREIYWGYVTGGEKLIDNKTVNTIIW